jgi:regulatory protein
MNDPLRAAYAAGLALLSRRELSEAQLRERLARKEHPPEAIDDAVRRLIEVRALDDRRVALTAARTEAQVKSRGRVRVLRRLQALGISEEIAREAADEVFGAVDERALLERALARRLRGPASTLRDPARFRRLFQQLVRQGFAPALVLRALKAHARHEAVPDEEEA